MSPSGSKTFAAPSQDRAAFLFGVRMSIAADVESLIASLRSKVGSWPSEVEGYFATFVHKARADEEALAAYIAAEIAHLESVGYKVALVDAPVAPIAAPVEAALPIIAPDLIAPAETAPIGAPIA
jgi:hypothetical protein